MGKTNSTVCDSSSDNPYRVTSKPVIAIALELTEEFHLPFETQFICDMRIKTTGNEKSKLCKRHLLSSLLSADLLLLVSKMSIFHSGC